MPNMLKVRPADISEDVAESIVISWIQQETPPPTSLSAIVAQYRNLVAYVEKVDDPGADQIMNKLYDRLMAVATAKLVVSSQVEAQLRRIQRKEEASMSWSQKCNRAIAQWEAGVRV